MKEITLILLLSIISTTLLFGQKKLVSKPIATTTQQKEKLQESFTDFKVVEIDLPQFKRDVSSLQETRITWDIDESLKLDMVIFPHDIRSWAFDASIISDDGEEKVELPENITYKGYLPDGKSIRLTIDDNFIYGKIETENGWMAIDQLKYAIDDKSLSSNKIVIYNTNDVKSTGGYCATENKEADKEDWGNGQTKSTSSGCKIVEVALDCDQEYWDDYNDDSFARMLGEINMIQGTYEQSLDVVLSVTSVHAILGNGYTSTDPFGIDGEINNIWSSSPFNGYTRDLVHHFTGKNTGPFGYASHIGASCSVANPRAWSEDRANVDQTVAHEIGHILNGEHFDGNLCSGSSRSIMCQGDPKLYYFSSASITRITNFLNNNNCFNFNTATISGDNSICLNNTRSYTLTNFDATASTNITWSTNSRLSIVSGQGTETVTVSGSGNGSGVLTAVIGRNGFCGDIVETKNIYVGPEPLDISVWMDSSGWATVSIIGGSTPYSWTLNGSTTGTSYSNNFNVYVGCNGGYFYAQSTDSCGSTSGSTFIPGCSGGGGPYYMQVHPNPANNYIFVSEALSTKDSELQMDTFDEFVTINLYDFTGKLVKSKSVNRKKGELKMDVSDINSGNYFLKIVGKEIDETHQIIIE